MNTPNEDSVKMGQIWFDTVNNEAIQLEHFFPCMGVSGYNGDLSNENEILRFDDLRVATEEEMEQFKMIREDWKVAERDDS